jgi:hypothetical protein
MPQLPDVLEVNGYRQAHMMSRGVLVPSKVTAPKNLPLISKHLQKSEKLFGRHFRLRICWRVYLAFVCATAKLECTPKTVESTCAQYLGLARSFSKKTALPGRRQRICWCPFSIGNEAPWVWGIYPKGARLVRPFRQSEDLTGSSCLRLWAVRRACAGGILSGFPDASGPPAPRHRWGTQRNWSG